MKLFASSGRSFGLCSGYGCSYYYGCGYRCSYDDGDCIDVDFDVGPDDVRTVDVDCVDVRSSDDDAAADDDDDKSVGDDVGTESSDNDSRGNW